MKIKSLRLALEQAATRRTQPGRAPASIFGADSTGAETPRRQRATPRQFHRPASAAPEASKSLALLSDAAHMLTDVMWGRCRARLGKRACAKR